MGRIVNYGNLGYAYLMVMMQAFNSADDTITPTIVNFFGFWLLEIPLAYASNSTTHALELSLRLNPVAESAMAAARAILFKQGKWRKNIT